MRISPRVYNIHLINLYQYGEYLTLNIPSLARQRCLPSWGPRGPHGFFFFVISQLFDAVDYSNYVFWVFCKYNSVIQALLASNILCLFIQQK